jgi:hypothetical protein
LHVREQQTSGSNSTSSLSNGAWSTRVLNTSLTNQISSATLVSNQISLPVGTYQIISWATYSLLYSYGSQTSGAAPGLIGAQLRLQNITGAALILSGLTNSHHVDSTWSLPSGFFNHVGWIAGTCTLGGQFTLGGTTTIELQMMPRGPSTCLGGLAFSTGQNEVFAEVFIWKLS